MRRNYNMVDFSKFILSFFVIAIHTNPSSNLGGGIAVGIYETIIRVAVPLFFLFSGYLVFVRKPDKDQIKKYGLKILKLYLIWSAIYLPLSVYNSVCAGTIWWKAAISYAFNLVIVGEHWYSWPLWYLLSTFYSVVAVLIIGKIFQKNKHKAIFVVAVSAISFVVAYALTGRLNEGYGRIFTGFFYFSVGMFFAQLDMASFCSKKAKFVLIGLFLMGFVTEVLWANLISKWVLYIALFLIIINSDILPDSEKWLTLRKASSIIYFIHMYIFFVITLIRGEELRYGWDSLIICSLVCIAISACLLSNERIYKSRAFKLLFG